MRIRPRKPRFKSSYKSGVTLQNQSHQKDQTELPRFDAAKSGRPAVARPSSSSEMSTPWEARELRQLATDDLFGATNVRSRVQELGRDFLGLNKLRAAFAPGSLRDLSFCRLQDSTTFISARGGGRNFLSTSEDFFTSLSLALVMVLVGTIGRLKSDNHAIAILFALLWLIPILRLLPLDRPVTVFCMHLHALHGGRTNYNTLLPCLAKRRFSS